MTKLCPTCGQRTDKKPRSRAENNYYWGVIIQMISDETGNDTETVHNALKMLHLPRQFAFGIQVPKSTKNLSTVEFEEYMTRCRVWASEQGIFIPLPNETEW